MKIDKLTTGDLDVMVVDGVPQSVSGLPRGGYWPHLIPEEEVKSALILGVAGGTIPRLLIEKYPQIELTCVDNSQEIVDWARENFDLSKINMDLVVQDGFFFVKTTSLKFDLIVVDMWDGYWFPFKSLTKEFIDQCKKRLNKGGWVYVNTPNLDWLAGQSFEGGLRDDIGQNIIYRVKKRK
jgi:spermidine synthase